MGASHIFSDSLPRLPVRIRARRALRHRLKRLEKGADQDPRLLRRERNEQIALEPLWAAATPQLCWGHLPLEFWQLVLGSRLHVGAALWQRWTKNTDEAEAEWCKLVAERLQLEPGQRVLEIGACPGVLARWAEAELPGLDATLLASNRESGTLLGEAVAAIGPAGAGVPQASLTDYSPAEKFDRILVAEGLTRSANPCPLLERMTTWLAPEGRLLLQIAVHWRHSYEFAPGDENRWMLPEVPDGALFPGQQYLNDSTRSLGLLSRWELSGEHYQRTARAWLNRLETNSAQLITVLAQKGVSEPKSTLRLWREALQALEVMYGFREGQEWCLTQLLLAPSLG